MVDRHAQADELQLARLDQTVRALLQLDDEDIVLVKALQPRGDQPGQIVVVTMQADSLRTWRVPGTPESTTIRELRRVLVEHPDGRPEISPASQSQQAE
jgi:hypothetical protein